MYSMLPSPRETTVLRFIAWGCTNKEIAALLKLSVKTIESHRANAMRKLRLRNRFQVVRYALAQGWLALDTTPDRLTNFFNVAGAEQTRVTTDATSAS